MRVIISVVLACILLLGLAAPASAQEPAPEETIVLTEDSKTTSSAAQWATLSIVLGVSSISFLLLLTLGYANNRDLSKGEMRRAITAFFVVLFGSLVASSFIPVTEVDLPPEIQGLFAGAVTTIIGFYFGSRTTATPPT